MSNGWLSDLKCIENINMSINEIELSNGDQSEI